MRLPLLSVSARLSLPPLHFHPAAVGVGIPSSSSALVQVRAPPRNPFRRNMSGALSEAAAPAPSPLPAAGGGVDGQNRPDDGVVVQYVVLRRDLIDTWPLGSVVTQGCHAAVAAVWAHQGHPDTVAYCSDSNIDFMHKARRNPHATYLFDEMRM